MRRIAALLLCALLLLTHAQAFSEDADPTPSPSPVPTAAPVANSNFIIEPILGYDGLLSMNCWMPTRVTITNNGPDFDGTLGVNVFEERTKYSRYDAPVQLASGATKEIVLPIYPKMRQDMYAFELVQGGEIVAEMRKKPSRVIAPESVLVGLLSEDAKALSYMNVRASSTDTLRGEAWTSIPLTLDTMPETVTQLNSFSILVVDGVDPRLLSTAQQDTLKSWLRSGGIVFVSGGAKAAASYPFFESITGISVGKIIESEDITPDLLSFIESKGSATGKSTWLSPIPEGRAIVSSAAGDGLISIATAENGLIYNMAFDLSEKSFSTWPRMVSLFPRMLRQTATQPYEIMLQRQDSRAYGSDLYTTRNIIEEMRMPNDQNVTWIVAILIAYIALVGFIGYFLLKRFDRREWLWAFVPATAAVFLLLFYAMSIRTDFNEPIMLAASQITLGDGEAEIRNHVGIATKEVGEITVRTNDSLPTVLGSEYYYGYYGDDADTLFRPLEMTMRYTFGETPSIGLVQDSPWKRRMMQLPPQYEQLGNLEARVWVEGDGMHGEVTNTTDMVLEDCMVASNVGYSQLGTLLPGQRVTFEMLTPTKTIDLSKIEILPPDTMLSSLVTSAGNAGRYGGYGAGNAYDKIDASIQTYGKEKPRAERDRYFALRRSLVTLYEDTFRFYETNGVGFYLFGFADTTTHVDVSIDDVPVTRSHMLSVVGAKVDYEPIGPTGHVLYPDGVIPFERMMDQGDESLPRNLADSDSRDMWQRNANYIDLTDVLAGRFKLPDFDRYTVQELSLYASSGYETMPEFFLYNHALKQWEEMSSLSVHLANKKLSPYLDDEGCLYVRYVPTGTNRYGDMSVPMITVKGEVK